MSFQPPEEPEPQPKKFPLPPDSMMLGLLALAAVVAAGFAAENQRLRNELRLAEANYEGVVAVLNQRKPCDFDDKEVSQNGDTRLRETATSDSGDLPG